MDYNLQVVSYVEQKLLLLIGDQEAISLILVILVGSLLYIIGS